MSKGRAAKTGSRFEVKEKRIVKEFEGSRVKELRKSAIYRTWLFPINSLTHQPFNDFQSPSFWSLLFGI
jgi:hypothetical protein